MAQSRKSKQTPTASSTERSGFGFGAIIAVVLLAILGYAGYEAYTNWAHAQSVESAQQLEAEVLQATERFKDSNGYVIESDLGAYQEAAYEAVRDFEGGWFEDSGKTQDGVWVRLVNGFTMIFDPPTEDSLGADVRIPCFISEYKPDRFPEHCDRYFAVIDGNGGTIAGHFDNWYPDGTSFGSVTLEAVDRMGMEDTQQIILWTGHGSFVSGKGCYLNIGEKFDWDLLKSDKNRYGKYDSNTLAYHPETGQMGISPEFVEKYVENLDGALVYLGSCFSAHDSKLADAFISKGADTVIGYSDKTHLYYHARLSQAFTQAMCTQNADGTYLDVQNAMKQAKSQAGETDAPIDGVSSRAKIYGDASYAFENGGTAESQNPVENTAASSTSSAKTSSSTNSGDTQGEPAELPAEAKQATKRTQDGMWFLPAQNGDYGYGSITKAYISGNTLVFIGGGASLGWSQGDGVMAEDQPGKSSSFALTDNTTYTYGGSTISKAECTERLANGTSLDWIQVEVSNGVATAVHL